MLHQSHLTQPKSIHIHLVGPGAGGGPEVDFPMGFLGWDGPPAAVPRIPVRVLTDARCRASEPLGDDVVLALTCEPEGRRRHSAAARVSFSKALRDPDSMLKSGRPNIPTHLLKGFPGPPGPARPPKSTISGSGEGSFFIGFRDYRPTHFCFAAAADLEWADMGVPGYGRMCVGISGHKREHRGTHGSL